MSQTTAAPAGWGYCATVGFGAAIMALLGYNIWICDSILGGTLWTLYVAGFFLVMPPLAVIEVIGFGLATAFAVRALSNTATLRNHIALAILLVPLLSMALSYGVARAVGAEGRCSSGNWR
jgi:hypothetical protein